MIHGDEDGYVPPANARALAEAIPGAKLQMIEEAGHLVFVERFADVNREVVRFLKTGNVAARRGDHGAAGESASEVEGWLRGPVRALRGWVVRVMAAMWGFLRFPD